jgi:hypothetical protein
MPVAQYSGQVKVPLYQHPFSNPFILTPNCSGGTVVVASINSGNGKAGQAATATGYNQPAVASWRKRNHTLIANAGNTNLGTQNNQYNQFYLLYQQQLFWNSANGPSTGDGTEQYATIIICPDNAGDTLSYPESNESSRIIGQYPTAGIESDPYNILLTLNHLPGIMKKANKTTPAPGYVLNSFDGSVANIFTNLNGITITPDENGLDIALSCPDFVNDNNNFMCFDLAYPQYAQIQFNYLGEGVAIVQTDTLTFDNGAPYWSNGSGGWNESANGFVYSSDDPLNGIPYTVIFLSRDMQTWSQIVFEPQDDVSTQLAANIGTGASVKPMQDDEGVWFLTGRPGITNAIAVSIPAIPLPPPIKIGPLDWNNHPIALPCVKIC